MSNFVVTQLRDASKFWLRMVLFVVPVVVVGVLGFGGWAGYKWLVTPKVCLESDKPHNPWDFYENKIVPCP